MALENLDRWTNSGPNHYDWAVAGIPFLSASSKEYPYVRESLDTNKQQIDTTAEVGEQALGNWWYRSQSSFDLGANAFYTDTARSKNISRRFYDSHGVDALEVLGQVTLLNESTIDVTNTSANLKTIGFSAGGVNGVLFSEGNALKYRNVDTNSTVTINYGATENILDFDTDGSRYFVLTPTAVYSEGLPADVGEKIADIDINEDGTTTAATAGIIKFIKERLIIGISKGDKSFLYQSAIKPIGATNILPEPEKIEYFAGSTTSAAGVRYIFKKKHGLTKGSNILKVEGSAVPQFNFDTPKVVYSVSGDGLKFRIASSTPPTVEGAVDIDKEAQIYLSEKNNPIQIYKTVASFWNWTALADGPNGIYCSGYSGEKSAILFSTIAKDDPDDAPELQAPYVVAELPPGEVIYSMVSYLSVYLIVGTNKGVRVAIIDSRGGLIMGPLSVESDNDVKALAVSGDFVYAGGAKTVEMNGTERVGIYKINLSKTIEENTLNFAYQKFLFADGQSWSNSKKINSITKINAIDKIFFSVAGVGIFRERDTKVATGWLETGKIRLDTAEEKIFQYLKVSNLPIDGFISVHWRDENNLLSTNPIYKWYGLATTSTISNTLTNPKGIKAVEMEGTIPVGGEIDAHEYVSYRFVLQKGLLNSSKNTPVLLSYQVKANPANIKQHLIRLPLLVLNKERGSNGLIIERPVFDRIRVIEKAEQEGKVVLFQDFGTGEERLAIIEKTQFISNHIPEGPSAAEKAGILLLTIRTVDPINITGSVI
jgi:hypothetical protein